MVVVNKKTTCHEREPVEGNEEVASQEQMLDHGKNSLI
jgi:hypothetical protein